jgi:hypothetical protein
MDKFKELSRILGGKIKSVNILHGNLNATCTRSIVIEEYQLYKVFIEDYGDRFLVGIPINCNLAFSVNNPDRIFAYKKLTTVKGFPFKIYTSGDDSDKDQFDDAQVLTFLHHLGRDLSDIVLLNNETVYVYNNHIYFSLSSSRDFSAIIERIVRLVDGNRNALFIPTRQEEIAMTAIPVELVMLPPLIKSFGVTDDFDRGELISKMSQREKENLVNAVSPLLIRINAFLDSFGDNELTQDAIQIAALAEMVAELKSDGDL